MKLQFSLLILVTIVERIVAQDVVANIEAASSGTVDRVVNAVTQAEGLVGIGVDNLFSDCFKVPNAFCIGGTSQVITGKGTPDDLVGWWTFDEIYPIDQSGNSNHMHPAITSGPAHSGHGASGAFVEGISGRVKHAPSLKSSEFTLGFWIYLLQDSTGAFRNIISKGSETELTPSILLYPNSRRLSVRISTDAQASEGMPSVGTIPLRRWTHIAVTCSSTVLKLFINGIRDTETVLRGVAAANSGDVVVGATATSSGFEGYLDDLRFYRRALPDGEMASMAMAGLTGIVDRDFLTLGCANCTYEKAFSPLTCLGSYSLCSLENLYEGGFHIARANGLLTTAPTIWYRDLTREEVAEEESRLALCCKTRLSAQPEEKVSKENQPQPEENQPQPEQEHPKSPENPSASEA